MISPKYLVTLSSKASLSGTKVTSNFKSKHNNPDVQLVCPGGLLTFIPPITPSLSKIQVLANEEDKPLSKKFRKIMKSFVSLETSKLHSFHGQKCSRVILERSIM